MADSKRVATKPLDKVKIVFVGNSGVGKTALFQRMKTGAFYETSATVGGACTNLTVSCNEQDVPLILWDTAGQDSFREIVPMYFNRAAFIIIVYDVTSEESFRAVTEWAELSRTNSPEGTHLLLVGNKVDRPVDERKISYVQGQKTSSDINSLAFLEVSAKEGICVEELLQTIADQILKDVQTKAAIITPENGVSLEGTRSSTKACC